MLNDSATVPALAPNPPVGPHVLFGIAPDGRCTLSVGDGLREMGLEPGQLVGINLLDLYAQDQEACDSIRRALAGETFTVEREFQGRILSVYYQPTHGEDGRPTGAMGVTTDVTAQRATERAARDARDRLTMLADLSAALTREVLHPAAVLEVASNALAQALGGAGALWVRSAEALGPEPSLMWGEPCPEGARPWLPPAEANASLLTGPEPFERDGYAGLLIPLVARGALVGLAESVRPAGEGRLADTGLVAEIADRCALALDNALLFQSERTAREDLIKFKALADASDDLIAITDPDGNREYTNARLLETGVSEGYDNVWEGALARLGAATAAEMKESLETHGRWSGDVEVHMDGRTFVLQTEVLNLAHPETGTPLGTAWIAQDVSALRSAESALREAVIDLKQFKALVEASPDFIAIAGTDGHVKYINPRGRALIGLDPEIDISQTTIADYLTPEGLEASLNIEQPAVVEHGHWEGQSTLKHHGGGLPVPVEIRSFLMRDIETGDPFALATVQRDITDRLAYEHALRDLADQRQALLTRLVDAREAERSQIAADVHDDPVQALSAVELRLGLLARKLRERAPDLMDTLVPLQSSVSGATDRLRALLFDLEPPDLDQGLTWALRRAAEETFADTEVAWTVSEHGPVDVAATTRVILYRIAREALTNVRKHADARHVDVTITAGPEAIEVLIADDGRGLGTPPSKPTPGHRGLFNMKDQAAIAGGRCTVADRPGGVLVTVWLPLVATSGMAPSH